MIFKKYSLLLLFTLVFYAHSLASNNQLRISTITTYLDSGSQKIYNDQKQAIYYYNKALGIAQKLPNTSLYKGKAYAWLAQAYYNTNIDSARFFFKKALQSLYYSEKYYLSQKEYNKLVDTYIIFVTLINNTFASIQRASQYVQKANNYRAKITVVKTKIAFHNICTEFLYRQDNPSLYDSALYHADQALYLAKKYKYYSYLPPILVSKASVFVNQAKCDSAIILFQQVIKIAQFDKNYSDEFYSYLGIIDCYINNSEYSKALKLINEIEAKQYTTINTKNLLYFLDQKAFVYEKLGYYQQQAQTLYQYIDVYDSLNNKDVVNNLEYTQKIIESEFITYQLKLNRIEIKQDHNLKYLTCIIIVSILLIMFFYQKVVSDEKEYLKDLFKNYFIIPLVIYVVCWVFSYMLIIEEVYISKQALFLSFSLINFSIPLFYRLYKLKLISRGRYDIESTTFQKSSLLGLCILSVITANIAFALSVNFIDFEIKSLVIIITLLVVFGVLAVMLVTYVINNSLLKYHLHQATLINAQLKLLPHHHNLTINTDSVKQDDALMIEDKEEENLMNEKHADTISFSELLSSTITIIADNSKDEYCFTLQSILYIEADDNYCEIHYLQSSILKRLLIRVRLKNIETQLSNYSSILKRSHRSYMINLAHVISVEGNTNGYKLSVNGSENKIPVAKTYGESILNALKNRPTNNPIL